LKLPSLNNARTIRQEDHPNAENVSIKAAIFFRWNELFGDAVTRVFGEGGNQADLKIKLKKLKGV
jgi:hypothetical protein